MFETFDSHEQSLCSANDVVACTDRIGFEILILSRIYYLFWLLWQDVDSKVAGEKVYPRQTWNLISHVVSAFSNHEISLWCHRPMNATQADACMYHRDRTYLFGMYCMHCPVTSQANACRYCMGSKVLSLSWIYLYPSYFV